MYYLWTMRYSPGMVYNLRICESQNDLRSWDKSLQLWLSHKRNLLNQVVTWASGSSFEHQMPGAFREGEVPEEGNSSSTTSSGEDPSRPRGGQKRGQTKAVHCHGGRHFLARLLITWQAISARARRDKAWAGSTDELYCPFSGSPSSQSTNSESLAPCNVNMYWGLS